MKLRYDRIKAANEAYPVEKSNWELLQTNKKKDYDLLLIIEQMISEREEFKVGKKFLHKKYQISITRLERLATDSQLERWESITEDNKSERKETYASLRKQGISTPKRRKGKYNKRRNSS